MKQLFKFFREWFNENICIFFHNPKVVENNYFTDVISGKKVNKYKCEKCNKSFIATRKRSLFRVYTSNSEEQ